MSTVLHIAPAPAAAPAALAPAATRLRLTRRGRIVFTTLAAVPLVVGAVAFAVNGGAADAAATAVDLQPVSFQTRSNNSALASYATSNAAVNFDYVTIESGQSLWNLAESIAPSADPRDVVADIVHLNALPDEAVQPGQRIAIPTRYE